MKNSPFFNLSTYSLALLALLPVLPLFVPWHLNPVASFHYEWVAIILGLLAWLFALPMLWQQPVLQIPRLTLLPLVLMAFIGIQAQILPIVVIQHAQMGMLYLLWAALLMVLIGLLAAQTDKQQLGKCFALGLAVAAVCSTGIEFAFRIKGMSGWWGGVGQANNYGDLLALGLASALYLLTTGKKSGTQVLLWITAAVIVFGLSLTPSRSVWLYWIVLLIIGFLWQRSAVKALFVGLGIYLLLQFMWSLHPLATDQVAATSAQKLYQSVGGTSARLHIWQVAWQLFTQSPWLGQGFGQFDWGYFQTGQHIPELPNRVEHGHNLILHLLAELGLLPVLMLVGLLVVWLKNILATLAEKRTAETENSLPFYAWLLSLVAILGIHSLLEYPLWYAPFLGIAAITLALGETQYWQLRLPSVGAIAVSLLITAGIGIASIHEWHYSKIETALTADSAQSPAQIIAKAAAQAPLLTPYVAVVFSLSGDLGNEKMRSDLTILNDAGYHFLPVAPLVYQKAGLQALNGFTREAQQTMKLALLGSPEWAKNFAKGLEALNAEEQKKTDFLRKMANKNS